MGGWSWSTYVTSLREYVFSIDGASDRIYSSLAGWPGFYGITEDQVDLVHEYVIGDDFWGNLSNYSFFIGPGIRQKNGYEYCPFLASDTIYFLLGINLCSTDGDYLSLRMICPQSCLCSLLLLGCAPACYNMTAL